MFAPSEIQWKAPGKNAKNDDLLVFRVSGVGGSFFGHLAIKGKRSKGEQKTKEQLVRYFIFF